MTIFQWQLTHVIDMLFSDADKKNSYYNKKYEEYPQGKDQVYLGSRNIFCELLKHNGNYLLAVLLAFISVPKRYR